MDFEHVFDQLEITTDPFAVCELQGRCDLNIGRDANVSLHYILTGVGALIIHDYPTIEVAPGSLILIPALHSHTIRSFNSSGNDHLQCNPPELKLRHLLQVEHGGETSGRVSALCAHVRVGLRGAVDVIDLIRSPIVEQIDPQSPMHPSLKMLLSELSQPKLGSRAMIRVLLTQCLIEMLRRRLVQGDEGLRWMAALRDPTVWEALRTMLDEPGAPHTVESLANKVGMSRSAFAARFTAAYGSGPIDLLREFRIRQAAALLGNSELPIKRIADMVGFNSRTAFSRVFEKRIGQSPTHYRQSLKHP